MKAGLTNSQINTNIKYIQLHSARGTHGAHNKQERSPQEQEEEKPKQEAPSQTFPFMLDVMFMGWDPPAATLDELPQLIPNC